jgi:integrase
MKEQNGYVFHKGSSWFVRYRDNVVTKGGAVKRVLVCKKLKVEYGGAYRTKASVREFVKEILAPINTGKLNPISTMPLADFVEQVYFPQYVEQHLRPSTKKHYYDTWRLHVKNRAEAQRELREFRTVDAEQMLQAIARKSKVGRHALKHIKSFLSGVFKQAKRLGVLDGVNPIQDSSVPFARESDETYAYSLNEVKQMLSFFDGVTRAVLLTAALSGLRKGEILGLTWDDFDGETLTVRQAYWNGIANEPKTRRSKAPVPVVRQLAESLEEHRQRMGKLAAGPIFQAGNGRPLNLDNLASRVIAPALSRCVVCKKREDEHKPEGHLFERDKSIVAWHGWHAFRRGLATNLYQLGVKDKDIQAILRHSNVGVTMNIYVKSVSESQVAAMDSLGEKLALCNDCATNQDERQEKKPQTHVLQ